MKTTQITGTRRRIFTGAGALGLGALFSTTLASCGSSPEAQASQTEFQDLESAQEIWDAMLEGNQRWANGKAKHPNTDVATREALIEGQTPKAAVITCVDSRVGPELVFDTGIGDLMTTRSAGNVLDPLIEESVSYGPAALESPLLVVLGHQNCGAVTAAHEALVAAESGEELEDHGYDLSETVEALRPAYEESKGEADDPVLAMIRANVELTVQQLSEHKNMAEHVDSGALTIIGAYYSFDTGLVTGIE
ncbi:hypothetical protein L0U85_01505 [Glycomyces sp. L485]|uniref:carbonic anhydrase n=1 Tax=Glycomyces sp. L485 TaxID=2909235 RepID=UPI001F4B840F|nr:carbonic anhydrase [Glycomyces sp. L485]MCH7229544.1 hypothetical protein [Glycomyces sp. L485]